MSDLIDRQAAIEYLMTIMNWYDEDGYESDDDYKRECITDLINGVPSAQPDERMLHESCTDCPLYDKDRHSCPRFNKVIPVTLRELQSAQPEQRWIPFKTRPLTEEEQDEHPEWDCILDCKLPDDGQAILVSINLRGHERVQYDEFYTDDGSYLDSGYAIGAEATAWMPLPEPWREENR